MATDGMRTLIDHALSDSSLCEALLDIQEYKKSLVARFSKEDLEILEDAGFQFSNNYVTQRRNELKTFLTKHPECTSGNFETLVDKITYFTTKQIEQWNDERAQRRRRAKQLAEANKKRIKKIIEPFADDDDDKPNEEEDKA